tara:strand:+ start:1062 stop:1241 length:180 start_codon:yes stop_codon:yes gene_type:complete
LSLLTIKNKNMQSIAKLYSLKEIYTKELKNWDTENENEFYSKEDIINTLNKIENKLKYL